MRLNEQQKDLVLVQHPGGYLHRIGDQWAIVWHDLMSPPRERWRAHLVKKIAPNRIGEQCVWWAGGELAANTRRAVVALLKEEALR